MSLFQSEHGVITVRGRPEDYHVYNVTSVRGPAAARISVSTPRHPDSSVGEITQN